MESRSTNRMMIFLIVVLFGVAIFGIVRYIQFSQQLEDNPWQNYKIDLITRAHSDVLDARKNWNNNTLPHYRLEITRQAIEIPDSRACTLDVEVQNEKVVNTFKDECTEVWFHGPVSEFWHAPQTPPDPTVSGLYELAEQYTSDIYWTRNGPGCEFFVLEVRIDPQRGYPAELAYRVQTAPRQMGIPIKAEYFHENEPAPVAACASMLQPNGPVITAKITPMQ